MLFLKKTTTKRTLAWQPPAFVYFTLLLWLVACSTPAATPTSPPATLTPVAVAAATATATNVLTATPSPTVIPPTNTPATTPTNTIVPTHTPVPGFEGWSMLNRPSVSTTVEGDTLVLTLQERALWFMAEQGVLFYQDMTGNFKITAQVTTSKSSNPAQPPGGDGTVQLGGVMARHGSSSRENYVFIVVGNDGGGLAVETKTTQADVSEWEGVDWDSNAAKLRLCRVGDTFNLYKRHIETEEVWLLAAAIPRPDLPDILQVGINIYSDSAPDLQVRYDNVRIEPVTSEADCISN